MRTALAVFCSTAMLMGCAPQDGNADSFGWKTLAKGESWQAGCEPASDRLLRTDEEWAAYWTEVHPEDEPARPTVDFAHDSVLVTCGPHTSLPSEITDVRRDQDAAGTLEATVVDSHPGQNCLSPAVDQWGHHAVKVRGVYSAAQFAHEDVYGMPCPA